MLHLQNSEYVPKDAPEILRRSRKLCSDIDAIIRDVRISSKNLELDVSIEKRYLEKLLANLNSLGALDDAKHVIEEICTKEEAVKRGIYYFNNERFWECHEVLEGVWKNCFEGEKDLVQGIILVAAAFVHYQKNENEICVSILGRALDKLANSTGEYYKINIEELKNKISSIINSGNVSNFKI